MNEFGSKKLGEVLAFAKVSNETIEKAKKAFLEILSEDEIKQIVASNNSHIEKITSFATGKNVLDIVVAKSEKTSQKLVGMRDTYVGDAWEDAVEICEWWGFFGGASVAHWNLVKGIIEKVEDDDMMVLVYDAIALNQSLYDNALNKLTEIGRASN